MDIHSRTIPFSLFLECGSLLPLWSAVACHRFGLGRLAARQNKENEMPLTSADELMRIQWMPGTQRLRKTAARAMAAITSETNKPTSQRVSSTLLSLSLAVALS